MIRAVEVRRITLSKQLMFLPFIGGGGGAGFMGYGGGPARVIRSTLALLVLAFFVSACNSGGNNGGSGSPNDHASDDQASNDQILTGSLVGSSDTNVVEDPVNDILSKDAQTGGLMEISVSGDSPLSDLGKNDIILVFPGEDPRFPFGYSGKVTSIESLPDGGKSLVLEAPEMLEVFDEINLEKTEIELSVNNLVGIIQPFSDSNDNRNRSGLVNRASVDIGTGFEVSVYQDLVDVVDDPSGVKALAGDGGGHATGASVFADLSIEGIRLTLESDIEKDIFQLVDVEKPSFLVKAEVDNLRAALGLEGYFETTLGYYSQAWERADRGSISLFGYSLAGLQANVAGESLASEKIGKIPIAGFVYNFVTNVGYTSSFGETQTPLGVAISGDTGISIIIWVYANLLGDLTLNGEAGTDVSTSFTIGLEKEVGETLPKFRNAVNSAELNIPYFTGSSTIDLQLGVSIEADVIMFGIRPFSVGADVLLKGNAEYQGDFANTYSSGSQEWSWIGEGCFSGYRGHGIIFHADSRFALEGENSEFQFLNLAYQYPSKEEQILPGQHGFWWNYDSISKCIPVDLDSDVDGDGLPNLWEIENSLDFHDAADADIDSDGDGYTNREEFINGTDPGEYDPPPPMDHGEELIVSNRTGDWEIFKVGIDGSNPKNLSKNAANDRLPDLSPDRSKIAFVSDRDGGDNEIYIMNVDGSQQQRLTESAGDDATPKWSPDSSSIVFLSKRDGNLEIYTMDSLGENQQRLTDTTEDEYSPSWSPDSGQLVFVSERDGNEEIYIMNRDGSEQNNLTGNTASDSLPFFSPDGSWISFISDRDGDSDLWIMDTQGGNLRKLTGDGDDQIGWYSWSPDGSRLIFDSKADGDYEIFSVNYDGTNLVQLTDNTYEDRFSSFAMNGDKVLFVTDRDGNNEVYSMNPDGSNQVNLSNDPSDEALPAASPIYGEGGGCFIATAAFGSYLEPEVVVLREFRDDYLITNPAGAVFVRFYYDKSPPVADYIRRHEVAKVAAMLGLTPLVYAIKHKILALILVVGIIVLYLGRKVVFSRKICQGCSGSRSLP